MSVAAPVAAVAPTLVESQLNVGRVIGGLEARLVAMEAELRVLRQQRDDARQALDERVDGLRRDLDDLDGRTRSAGGQATAAARNGRLFYERYAPRVRALWDHVEMLDSFVGPLPGDAHLGSWDDALREE